MFEKLVMDIVGATSEQDISNKLGQIFSQNSSPQNYNPEFQNFKNQKEKTKLNFKSKRKLSRLSDVGCFSNRRSAFLRFLMASLHSSLNHDFPGYFGFVEVFGIVSSAIDITKQLEDFISQEGLGIFNDLGMGLIQLLILLLLIHLFF
jgi:hypothetical protein